MKAKTRRAIRSSLKRSMVPGVGIEPTTPSSSGLRSTTELPRRIKKEVLRKDIDYCTDSDVFVNNTNEHILQLLIESDFARLYPCHYHTSFI